MKLDFKATCSACGFATEPIAAEKTTTEDGVEFRHEALVCRQCSVVTYDKVITNAETYRGKDSSSLAGLGQKILMGPSNVSSVMMPAVGIIEAVREGNGVRSLTLQDGATLECPRVEQCDSCGSENLIPLFTAPGLRLNCPSCGERALRY